MWGLKGSKSLTGLFMNFRVISRASGGRVAENTPTCMFRICLMTGTIGHTHKPFAAGHAEVARLATRMPTIDAEWLNKLQDLHVPTGESHTCSLGGSSWKMS